MRLRQLERFDPDLRLGRRDRWFVDFDFVRQDYRLGKLRSSQLMGLPGMSYTGGAGFKTTSDAAGAVLGPFPANDPGLSNRGVGLWRAATNQFQRSQELGDAYWTKFNSTIAADAANAPDGTLTADRITATAGAADAGVSRAMGALTSGQPYTFSAYVMAESASIVSLYLGGSFAADPEARFNLATGVATFSQAGTTARIVALPGGVYRIAISATTNSASPTQAFLYAYGPSTAAGQSFVAWGLQFEQGNDASPYIPTTTAAATRTADSLRLNFARWPIASEFSVFAEYEVQHTQAASYAFMVANAATAPTGRNTWFIGRNGSGVPNSNGTGDAFGGIVSVQGATPITAKGSIVRVAGSVSPTKPPDVAVNGSFITGGVPADDIFLGINTVIFGNPNSGSNECLTGYLRRFALTPKRLGPGFDLAASNR